MCVSLSGVVDDDESRTGRLLTRLTHSALLSRLGEHSWRVQVVDSGLEETGSQSQTQHLPRLQLQLVLGLPHPGERAVHLHRLWAETGRKGRRAYNTQYVHFDQNCGKFQIQDVRIFPQAVQQFVGYTTLIRQ